MKLIVLSIGREREDRHDDVCSTETFEATVAEFPDLVRYEAANMAAHNWDVLVIDEQLVIAGASHITFYNKDGIKVDATKEQMNLFYPVVPKEDYKTPSQTIWIGKKAIKRHNEIQLAWLGPAGKRFMAVEEIMKKYRYDTRNSNWKRVNGEYWDDERQIQNYKNRCKKFREHTTEIINQLFGDENA